MKRTSEAGATALIDQIGRSNQQELRRDEDEESEEIVRTSKGALHQNEDSGSEDESSDQEEEQQDEDDRKDQSDEEFPQLETELERYDKQERQQEPIKGSDGAEIYKFKPPSRDKGKKDGKDKKQPGGFAATLNKYKRGDANEVKRITDKKLQAKLRKTEKIFDLAATSAARSELLLTEQAGFLEAEGPLGRTERFSQQAIAKNVDVKTRQKMFDLSLPTFGPYCVDYSRNGRHLLIAGAKGHISALDWIKKKLAVEFHVKEVVKDIKYLHTEKLFAAAQKKYVYIYDDRGTEVHCLKKHIAVNKLEFLPYHFLLASVGETGWLKYQDISTGDLVVEHRTKLGPCNTMTQNPWNAIIHLGHQNGTVTFWNPNMSQPLVRMLCHRGVVTSIAIDRQGNYMVTAGTDAQVKVWDVRTFQPVHAYYSPAPASNVQISQLGLLAVSHGSSVQVWKNAFAEKQKQPYMRHQLDGNIVHDIAFAPYEDVLGIGHDGGFASMLVPGAGEPNFDAFEANPYSSKKQRREMEVHQLLEKIPATMITLDPTSIGKVDKAPKHVREEEKRKAEEQKAAEDEKDEDKDKKRRAKRRARRAMKRDSNIWDKRKADAQEKKSREEKKLQKLAITEGETAPSALARFRK